jgi:ADP-ribose 1''-phosphate phosphatase
MKRVSGSLAKLHDYVDFYQLCILPHADLQRHSPKQKTTQMIHIPVDQPSPSIEVTKVPAFRIIQTSISSVKSILSCPSTASTTFLVHGCNCLGNWGAGIALELRQLFPRAFEADRQSCQGAPNRASLPGTCLLIPFKHAVPLASADPTATQVSIACLRTSLGCGRPNQRINKPGLDGKSLVIAQTRSALGNLRMQLEEMGDELQKDIVIWSPRLNSGAFRVPWQETEGLIKEVFADWPGQWCVMQPPPVRDLEQWYGKRRSGRTKR